MWLKKVRYNNERVANLVSTNITKRKYYKKKERK